MSSWFPFPFYCALPVIADAVISNRYNVKSLNDDRHYVPRQFMGHRFQSDEPSGLGPFALVALANLWIMPYRKVGGFHKGPRQIFILILGVALALAFLAAEFGAAPGLTSKASIFGEVLCNIHSTMEDADNFNMAGFGHPVENEVLSDAMLAIALANVITGSAFLGIV